jgi:phosphoesterase RecJ-like protein
MAIDWSELVQFISRHQRFLVLTHVRPDGDAIGCQLGMVDLLEQMGKQARPVIASRFPSRYRFMDTDKRIQRFGPGNDCFQWAQALIIVDTGVWGQLGDCGRAIKERDLPRLVIDHHLTQDDVGAIQLVDTTAEACGRLIVEAFDACGKSPSPMAASALFVALAMDTGWFHHSAVRADTFELASRLVRSGAEPSVIYQHLYERGSLARTRLLGRVLERMQTVAEGRIAYSEVLFSDYAATGAVPEDTEDFVQYCRAIDGVEVGILFIEQADGAIKVSFRSRDQVNVADIARAFGGGGHARASGATLPGPMIAARTAALTAVAAALVDGPTRPLPGEASEEED